MCTWTHTNTPIRGHAAESLNNWWWCGSSVYAKATGQRFFSFFFPTKQSQTGVAAASVGMTYAPMWREQAASPSMSHSSSKSRLGYEERVSSSVPLIGSDWDYLLFDWPLLESVEKCTPSFSFRSCSVAGYRFECTCTAHTWFIIYVKLGLLVVTCILT